MNEQSQVQEPRFQRIIRFLRVGKGYIPDSEKVTIPQAVQSLDTIVKQINQDSNLAAQIRETSGANFLNYCGPGLWEHFRTTPEVGLMLEFPKPGRTISQVYDCLETFNLETLAQRSRLSLTDSMEQESAIRGLLAEDHSLWFPLSIHFYDNHDKISAQENELRVHATLALTPEKREEVKRYCEASGLKLELVESTPENSTQTHFAIRDGGIYSSGLPCPETRLRLSWQGNNFDQRAIRIFGELRAMLYQTYRETVAKHAQTIVDCDSHMRDPRSVPLNQEGRPNESSAYFVAHLSSEIPFTHKEEKKKANLFYHHFYGNSRF